MKCFLLHIIYQVHNYFNLIFLPLYSCAYNFVMVIGCVHVFRGMVIFECDRCMCMTL